MLAKYYSRALPNASESLALSQVTQIRLTTQEEARDCRVQQLHPYDSAPHNLSTQHVGTQPYRVLDSYHPQRANQMTATGSSHVRELHPPHRSNSTALLCNSRTG